MIDNVLDESKQVGEMTNKIISHINKQKDEMLDEEANMRLREHNVEAKEEELCKKFAKKAAKRKAAKKQAALKQKWEHHRFWHMANDSIPLHDSTRQPIYYTYHSDNPHHELSDEEYSDFISAKMNHPSQLKFDKSQIQRAFNSI